MYNYFIFFLLTQDTVRLPKFFTLHTKYTVLPTKPVTLAGMDETSKYGPFNVDACVGQSCKNSVLNSFEPE